MRNKRAKLLRRAAETETVGMLDVGYARAKHALKPGDNRICQGSHIALHPDCTRALYQQKKRGYKRVSHADIN